MRRLPPVLLAVLAALLVGAGVALPADDPAALRDRAASARAQERALAGAVARLTAADRRLARQVAVLEGRRATLQADLARDEARLTSVRADLRAERARALRLRARLAEARAALATRLRERYQASDVDVLSVVLNAAGFADLLERAAFLRRIQDNDEEILVAVRTARADAVAERRRLDLAERRQRIVVAGVRARRNAVAAMADGVGARRAALTRVRAARTAALAATRSRRLGLERDAAAAARAIARAARAVRPPAPAAVPSGGWAIPWEIVQCESGGQNLPPNSAGASGYYQIMPATWKGLGGRGPHAHLRPKAEQDAAAAKLWAGGAGASNWVCADLVS